MKPIYLKHKVVRFLTEKKTVDDIQLLAILGYNFFNIVFLAIARNAHSCQ